MPVHLDRNVGAPASLDRQHRRNALAIGALVDLRLPVVGERP